MSFNVYLTVDPNWSYNFFGGLQEQFDLDHENTSKIYELTCAYLKERHRFLMTCSASAYNAANEQINRQLHEFDAHPTYFYFYWESLYRTIRVGFETIRGVIEEIYPVTTPVGEIVAFIVTCTSQLI